VRLFILLLFSLSLGACVNTAPIDESNRISNAPANWQTDIQSNSTEGMIDSSSNANSESKDYWPQQYSTQESADYLQEAIENNYNIQQLNLSVEIQERRLTVAQADLLPTLSLNFQTSRQQTASSLGTSNTLSLNADYEIDLWGKLSAQEKSAAYTYLSTVAQVEQEKQQLAADVLSAYANAIEAQQLQALYSRRSQSSREGLNIIEDGYQQGLNSALDVYLARNVLNSDLAREAQQQSTTEASVRNLETLVGRYPTGRISLKGDIPAINNSPSIGIPTDMVMNKPSLQASWLDMLAANSDLAFAHKQRFPSFTLSGSIGSSEEKIKDLFSSDLIWSVVGSVVAPLYNAGSLKANEDIARLTFKQSELAYWDELNKAFSAVENALSLEQSLQSRLALLSKAEENAITAEELSFEQYLKGLVTYTTVLDAQTRSVEAQSSVIQIKRELFTNRIALHVALGSNFGPTTEISEPINDIK
jgi:NodT family efflux transporter outer membrane factor (OMF) lipoprotein